MKYLLIGLVALAGVLFAGGMSSSRLTGGTDDDDMLEKKQPLDISQFKSQKVLVRLSHGTDDLHRAFSALELAILIQSRGIKTDVLVDIEGARLADNRQTINVHWGPSEETLEEVFDRFVSEGGTVVVAPHCAADIQLTPEHLRAGARIGDADEVLRLILEADKIIDY